MKVMTKLIGIAILTTAISAPAFAQMYETPYGRTVATAPARVHARTIARHYDQQSYAMYPRRAVGIYGGYSNYDLLFFSVVVPRPTPDMSASARGLKRSVWLCEGIWLRTYRCAGRLLFADG
jgi:hypothetical protein